MRKISTLCFSLLVASSINAQPTIANKLAKQLKHTPLWGISVPGMHGTNADKLAIKANGLAFGASAVPTRAESTPTNTTDGEYFGFLTGPDDNQWYYTQNIVWTSDGYYRSSDITVFDNNHKQQGKFTVTIPDGMRANSIEPYGQITKKLFDKNDKTYEVMVSIHVAGNAANNYQDSYLTQVYTLGTGEKVQELESPAILFDASQGWNTYQRVLLTSTEAITDTTNMINIKVYAPGGWNDSELKLEHTFTIPEENVNYSEGSYMNPYVINGKPYYVLSYYEKPYVETYDENFNIITTKDNHYIIKVFDRNYNQVDSIAVPLEPAEGSYCRMAMFGTMSDFDLSNGYFTQDGNNAFVVTLYDYITSSDSYLYNFYVYDHKGNRIKDICENAIENVWYTLNPIKGQEDQMVFLQQAGASQQYQTVNIPSCEKQVVIPAVINGENIGSPINRYPKGDSYQYVINMRNGDSDDEGNVIARIGWYNKDLTLDHFTKFNLGPDAEYFTPLLSSTVLNPYLFDTDDDMEFIYAAKKRHTKPNGTFTIDKSIDIAKSDGTIIRSFENDGKRSIAQQGILSMTPGKYELLVVTLDSTKWKYDLDFYALPFNKFTKGGDGTVQNPYLVSTVGDLQQISSDLKANYKVVNDINMNTYNGDWLPINNFAGVLDGDNKVISNLSIDGTASHAGLFGMLGTNATIKNIIFTEPTLQASASCLHAGILAGEATQDSIHNIHVYDANISSTTDKVDAVTGGIVGDMALYSGIKGSSFQGVINMPGASYVGGIVGQAATNSEIKVCATKADITGNDGVGGIAGATGDACPISNSHVQGKLVANNTIGGIAGSSERGLINNCIFSGNITANKASSAYTGLNAGGIVGSLASDWGNSAETRAQSKAITNCVVNGKINATPADNDKTVHGIVGKTIANEYYEPGETPKQEEGLTNNYNTSSTSDDNTSIEGANVSTNSLDKEFFTGLGYAYGESVESPWKDAKPTASLYFENIARSLALSTTSVNMNVDATQAITATVYGSTADDIEAKSSDTSVADVEISDIKDNKATLNIVAHKDGVTTITVTYNDLVMTCTVAVGTATGIANVSTTNNMSIKIANGNIVASGATSMVVYGVDGKLVAKTQQDGSVSTQQLGSGIYIVVATDNQGNKTTAKFVVK